jgi:hypothetical protein
MHTMVILFVSRVHDVQALFAVSAACSMHCVIWYHVYMYTTSHQRLRSLVPLNESSLTCTRYSRALCRMFNHQCIIIMLNIISLKCSRCSKRSHVPHMLSVSRVHDVQALSAARSMHNVKYYQPYGYTTFWRSLPHTKCIMLSIIVLLVSPTHDIQALSRQVPHIVLLV